MLKVWEIENAILDTLRADETLSGYVKAFEVLPDMDEETLKKLIMQFPAVGVFSPEGDYRYMSGSVEEETGFFLVLCFHRNVRSPSAARGAELEKGIWDLVGDCKRVLLTGSLGVDVKDCLPLRRRLLWSSRTWAAASLEVEVRWRNL